MAKGVRIQGVDWNVIQLAYQNGRSSIKELALQYGVHEHALESRARREKWRLQMQEFSGRVAEKMVEKVADAKAKAILAHEALVTPIATKLCQGVEKTYDDMNGEALEPSELQGLAVALKTANGIARLNLGAIDPVARVDMTTNGQSLHQHALDVLSSCRRLVAEGAVDAKQIDVKALLAEYKQQEEAGNK